MKQLSKTSQPTLKSFWRASALLVVMLAVAFSSTAQQKQGSPQQKKQMKFEHHQMLPDLTDAQKDQMKAIHIKGMKATQPLKNAIMEKRAHLNTLSSADKADIKAINKQIDDISVLQASIKKVRAANKQEIRSLLTDEQRVIFDARRGGFSHHKGGQGMKGCDGNGPHQKMKKSGHGQQWK